MSRTTLIILAIVVVLAIIGVTAYYLSAPSTDDSAMTPPPTVYPPAQPPEVTPPPTVIPPGQTPPPPAQPPTASPMVIQITNSGFVPAAVTVRAGQSVTFVNNSSRGSWPASDPHPVHTAYPTSGGCIGSTFDACTAIAPGASWSFTFTKIGTWGYHDHRNPSARGVVTVTQ